MGSAKDTTGSEHAGDHAVCQHITLQNGVFTMADIKEDFFCPSLFQSLSGMGERTATRANIIYDQNVLPNNLP